MYGAQGADVIDLVDPREAVPVHYEEYRVMKSPLSDFRAEAERRGLGNKIRYVERGASIALGDLSHPP